MSAQDPPACDKHRYPNQTAAIAVALRASRRSGTPLRVYRCPICEGYHLTKRRRWVK